MSRGSQPHGPHGDLGNAVIGRLDDGDCAIPRTANCTERMFAAR